MRLPPKWSSKPKSHNTNKITITVQSKLAIVHLRVCHVLAAGSPTRRGRARRQEVVRSREQGRFSRPLASLSKRRGRQKKVPLVFGGLGSVISIFRRASGKAGLIHYGCGKMSRGAAGYLDCAFWMDCAGSSTGSKA